jgi:soluble lytic murein transglycosylase-like protein
MIKKLLWLAFYSLPIVTFAAMRTEPQPSSISQPPENVVAAPLRVIIYRSGRGSAPGLFRAEARVQRPSRGVSVAEQLRSYVQEQALKHGVSPRLALWIVKHESRFNPNAKGDGEASRGLWQISRIYHPEVSDAVAFNARSSTQWSLERIREGKANEWSTYRFCRTLYEDCPF